MLNRTLILYGSGMDNGDRGGTGPRTCPSCSPAAKSSLLNALLSADISPVSALPATAVITRAVAGPSLVVRVHHLDGVTADIAPEQIGEFVTEAGNPR